MRGLRLVGEEENGNAFSLYGPMKAGLTTTHRTQSLQLSASLNLLERKVEDLTSRYLEVSNILTDVLERLVKLGLIGNGSSITEEEK
jgi:hypothetical protein